MTGYRVSPEGELQIFHPETGAYVPAGVLLQVDEGLRASLVPDQVALLSDIRNASLYLQLIENILLDVRNECSEVSAKTSQSNTLLVPLAQIDAVLSSISQAVDSLELLSSTTSTLVAELKAEVLQLSSKLPASLGAKIRDSSLSVALASDSTIFTSLSSLLSALSDGGSNSVYTVLSALSSKLPASLGAKIRDSSLSVTLASDSTIFTSLANILNALSDGGSNSTLSYLSTVAGAQFWKTPTKLNTTLPIINAATGASSSAAYVINSQTTGLSFQNFFSAAGLSAQFAIELRSVVGSSALSDKTYYYRGDVATPFVASTGAYPGESPIVVPTHGFAQVLIHLSAISGGGNVTTYAKEIR